MKNLIFAVLAAIATVVFSCPDMECANCAKKVQENIAFEKGVKDLDVNYKDRLVTVKFNTAKTDTVKLGNALKKLGYPATVKEYKEK